MGTGTGARPDVGGRKPVIVVQGGQWGSEAKGLVTHKLILERDVKLAIRTGTVNAGHTVYYKGKAYAMQQLPVSWVKPDCLMLLGAGAYINPEILAREIGWVAEATGKTEAQVIERIVIDQHCGIHLQAHTDAATKADRHHSIGTTGKGCSEAVIEKIKCRASIHPPLFAEWLGHRYGMPRETIWDMLKERIVDGAMVANQAYDAGEQVLVEGTQGTLLDLHHGDYPYTTHKQTQAANWLAEAGLSCTILHELWLVMRTFPIRVAGNSGPMPGEISWVTLARQINKAYGREFVNAAAIIQWEEAMDDARHHYFPECPSPDPAYWGQALREKHREAASELHALALVHMANFHPHELKQIMKLFETTTVTRKLRRIAEWDWGVAERSLIMNRPHQIALTFANYRWPKLWGSTMGGGLPDECEPWVNELESVAYDVTGLYTPVGMISFGPQIEHTHMLAR